MSDCILEQKYGLSDGLYQRLMAEALSRGGGLCDLFFQEQRAGSISLEDGEVNRASTQASLGVGIRVVQGDAFGYAFSEDLDERALVEAARTAAAIAEGGGRAPPQAIRARAPSDFYPVAVPWSRVSVEQKLPILHRVHERVFAADPRVVKVRLSLSDGESHVLVVDSDGNKAWDHRPMTGLTVACVAEQGGRREESSHSLAGRRGLDLYAEPALSRLSAELVERTMLLFEAVTPPAGEMPVVLAAGSSGILLHEAIGHGMEADFARKGLSIYSDKLGERVAGPEVSIVDDGTVPFARGSINVDDEGEPGQCTLLVDNGVLRSFMHDRISARHYGVAPTGNGRRESFRSAPLPRMRCTTMRPGPHTRDDIIRTVKRGLYAATFANGQVKIGAGDFTFYVKSGFLIEDGKLTAPVKDVNIVGNGPRALEQVDMVGDDFLIDQGGWTCGKDGQSVPVSIGQPTVKVAALTVSGQVGAGAQGGRHG